LIVILYQVTSSTRGVPQDSFGNVQRINLYSKQQERMGATALVLFPKQSQFTKPNNKHTANPNPTPRLTKTRPNMSMHTG
jgi:hypothetical protein